MIANEITGDRKWPWTLPDPHDLAVTAHKKIQNRLLHSRFRDNNKLMSSLLINYDKKDVDWKMYYKAAAAEDELTPAPAPAADEEAGAA